MALQLAKAGWWGGDPRKVLEADADDVLAALDYEKFLPLYESAFAEMNRRD